MQDLLYFCKKLSIIKPYISCGDFEAYDKIRQMRILEFRNTIELVKAGYYITEAGGRVEFGDDSEITVENIDCLITDNVIPKKQDYDKRTIA